MSRYLTSRRRAAILRWFKAGTSRATLAKQYGSKVVDHVIRQAL